MKAWGVMHVCAEEGPSLLPKDKEDQRERSNVLFRVGWEGEGKNAWARACMQKWRRRKMPMSKSLPPCPSSKVNRGSMSPSKLDFG